MDLKKNVKNILQILLGTMLFVVLVVGLSFLFGLVNQNSFSTIQIFEAVVILVFSFGITFNLINYLGGR